MRYFLAVAFFVKMVAADTKDVCDVIPIAQWAGQTSKRTQPLITPVNLVVIQHTVYTPCNTDAQCENATRNIRAYQMTVEGFDDIAQSFIVGGNGKVYEGAGWQYVGAHTLGYNNRSVSVSFLGDFRETLPTPEALNAAKVFLSCAVQNKLLTEEYRMVGHMQLSKTLSPGGTLKKEIQTWPHWTASSGVHPIKARRHCLP